MNLNNPKRKLGVALRKIREYQMLMSYRDRINNRFYNIVVKHADMWAKELTK